MIVPQSLKFISNHLQRGSELRSVNPVVSYYCLYYAAKMAIANGPKTPEVQDYIMEMLGQLEQLKQDLGSGCEAISNDVIGFAHIENFAIRIFDSADNEDRAGLATAKTAKNFYAASVFLEVLNVFGDALEQDYCKFKAVDIIKALKEGRVPVSGNPDGEEQSFAPPVPEAEQKPTFTVHEETHVVATVPAARSDNFEEEDHMQDYNEANVLIMQKASKHAKFAQSALIYEDVVTAIDNLEKALALLRPLH